MQKNAKSYKYQILWEVSLCSLCCFFWKLPKLGRQTTWLQHLICELGVLPQVVLHLFGEVRKTQRFLKKLPIFISRSVFQGRFCSFAVLHFCFCTSFFRSSPTPAPSPDADVHCWPGICQLFISCQFFQFPRPTSHGTVGKKGFFFGSWPLARQQWSQHPAICHQLLDGWRTLSAKLPGETKKWTKIN